MFRSLGVQTLIALAALAPCPLWAADNKDRPELVIQIGHASYITAMAFSPNGKQLLTASDDRTVILWEVATGLKLRTLPGSDYLFAVAFSPDGKQAFLGCNGRGAELWNLASGAKVRSFRGHKGMIEQAAFSPDGRQILTGSRDGKAILWETASGKRLRVFEGCKGGGGVAFSPDGRHVFTCAADGVILREAATGRQVRSFRTATVGGLGTLALSADGKRLLAGLFRSPAMLWDVGTGKELGTFRVGRVPGSHLAISPDGRYVLLEEGDVPRAPTLWEVASGRKVRTLPQPRDFVGGPVCFSPDGKYVLICWGFEGAALWEPGTGRKVRSFRGAADKPPARITLLSDGKHLLTYQRKQKHIVWLREALTGRKLRELEQVKDDGWGGRWAMSGDGKRLACLLDEREVCLWDTATGKRLRRISRPSGMLHTLALDRDGQRVLTGSLDGFAFLHNKTGDKPTSTFRGHTELVGTVALSPDGKQVFTGSWDRTVRLWDAASAKQLWMMTIKDAPKLVIRAAFRPDGKQILTSGMDGSLDIWDSAGGKKVRSLRGHTAPVNALALSPDGKRALTGSNDTTVILWDVESGRRLHTLANCAGAVSDVAFTPDGKRGLVASPSHSLRVWDLTTGKQLAELLFPNAGKDWLAVTPEGYYDGSEGGRRLVTWRVKNRILPENKFASRYHRPELVARALRGLPLRK